ncbi:VanZ family protein [Vibrio fluminensis]|uniref:VanZ family protein n=1 Tax=Vibrio fluminensis TaxID=2783614 RepID=UPI001886AD2C|nr:VanZ family protein [Vibrio fluminensis]
MQFSQLVVHRRLPFLCLLVLIGASASLTKSFSLHGGVVSQFEVTMGGDWVLHALMAFALGWTANWATPITYFRYYGFRVTPLLVMMLLFVSADEILQAFVPTREFSWLDLIINIAGLIVGALTHRLWLRSKNI